MDILTLGIIYSIDVIAAASKPVIMPICVAHAQYDFFTGFHLVPFYHMYNAYPGRNREYTQILRRTCLRTKATPLQ